MKEKVFLFVQKSGGAIAPLAPWVRRPWKTSQQVSPCSPYVIIWTAQAHSGHFSSSQLMEPKVFLKSNLNLNYKFLYLLHPEVHLFWEGQKNMTKSPTSFSLTKYVASNRILVAFLEYMNFNAHCTFKGQEFLNYYQ